MRESEKGEFRIVNWFWAIIVPALLLALNSLRGERRRAAYFAKCLGGNPPRSPAGGPRLPPATVIVPVKGEDEGLRENLAALAALDYPDYELIVAARDASDIPAGVVPPGARVVIAGPGLADTSEKIQNLLAAVDAARPASELFAFADSDGRVTKGWLRALASACEPPAGAATGYRWYVPEPPDFWSLLRSVWNAVILEAFRPEGAGLVWGGAMAIRREVFDHARVAEHWKGAVSDDFALSAAVRAAGLKTMFAPGAMVACTDHASAREFLGWARRQLILTRVYRARQWWMAFAATILYCAAMAACVAGAIEGRLAAEYALVALLFPGMLKGANRAALARAALPEYASWFKRYGWVHTWWVPISTWTWLGLLLASSRARTIKWRGVRYRLSAPRTKTL